MAHTKLSISLDEDLLRKTDSARKAYGETRSGLIRRLLICYLSGQPAMLDSVKPPPAAHPKKKPAKR